MKDRALKHLRVLLAAAGLAAGINPLLAHAPSAAASAAEAPSPAPIRSGPALWKVADEDTTIYLFGTVHILPRNTDWFDPTLAAALTASDTLVTEISDAAMKAPGTQQVMKARALLPEGVAMRAFLNDRQRAAFDAALRRTGLPDAAFDRYKPWLAAMVLSTAQLVDAGFERSEGVERILDRRAGPGMARSGLETPEQQLRIFDDLPMAAQADYLAEVAAGLDEVVSGTDELVAAWRSGDVEALARLMNDGMDDPATAERLLYARNRNWAQWVAARLAEPGTVFIAVGAAHLAGSHSVQHYLARGGLRITRIR